MGVVLKFFRSMEIPRSPWRVSLGGMPVTERRVDKQPSVAITIQIEYSYFSGTNLSFFFLLLTFGSCFSPRKNPHHSTLAGNCVWSRLLIQRWAVRFGFWREARTFVGAQWDAVRKECRVNSGGALGGDAPETQCLSRPLPPGSICLAQVLLHAESPVKQTRGQWSAIYLTSTGFYICPEITQLKGSFLFGAFFYFFSRMSKKRCPFAASNKYQNMRKTICTIISRYIRNIFQVKPSFFFGTAFSVCVFDWAES